MQSYVVDRPTSEGYYKLGAYLEHKRDFKRAMIYLKKAQALALLDEESE